MSRLGMLISVHCAGARVFLLYVRGRAQTAVLSLPTRTHRLSRALVTSVSISRIQSREEIHVHGLN